MIAIVSTGQLTDTVAGIDVDVADCEDRSVLSAVRPDDGQSVILRPAHLRNVVLPARHKKVIAK